MDCRKFQKNLEDYLQGGLDFPGRFSMERHARQCFCCEKELATAQKLSVMARELERVPAPPDFEAGLLRRIQTQPRRSPLWASPRFWIYDHSAWRLLGLSAAALGILGFGIYLKVQRSGYEKPGQVTSVMKEDVPAVSQPVNEPSRSSAPQSQMSQGSNPGILASVPLAPPRTHDGSSAEDPGFYGQIEPSEYVDYVVPGPGDRPIIVRLPKTIRMRYGQPSEDYFIRNVSH